MCSILSKRYDCPIPAVSQPLAPQEPKRGLEEGQRAEDKCECRDQKKNALIAHSGYSSLVQQAFDRFLDVSAKLTLS